MIYVLRSIITVEFHETSSLGNTFCYDSTSPEELAIDNTIGILTIIIKRLQKWFHVEKRAKKFGKGQMISNEIVWLIDVVKDAIMIKFKKEEEKRIEAEKMESKFNADVAHERKLNFKRRLNSLFTCKYSNYIYGSSAIRAVMQETKEFEKNRAISGQSAGRY